MACDTSSERLVQDHFNYRSFTFVDKVLVESQLPGDRKAMHLRQNAVTFRSFCARTFAVALAIALLLATLCQSQAADPEPKRVMMLHSFGLRFRPWTDYSRSPSRRVKPTGVR